MACDRKLAGVVALGFISVARNVRWYHTNRLATGPVIGDWYNTRASEILAVICVQKHVRWLNKRRYTHNFQHFARD